MATVFEAGNEELKLLREDRTLPRLDAYFRARICEWPRPLKHMECFTVSVFSDLGSAFRNGDAFELLETAAHLPWDALPDRTFLLGMDLLFELASASGTTEMPEALSERWEGLESRVKTLDATCAAWDLLIRHYRKQA